MRPYRFWTVALLGLCLAVTSARGLDPTRKTADPARKLDAGQLAEVLLDGRVQEGRRFAT